MVRSPPSSSTAMSKVRLRSATDIEKNSPCLPADEHAVDAEVVDPVAEVLAQAGLVDGEVGRERRQRRRPDALEVFAGVSLGIASAVFHGSDSFGLRRQRLPWSYLIRLVILSTIGFGVA